MKLIIRVFKRFFARYKIKLNYGLGYYSVRDTWFNYDIEFYYFVTDTYMLRIREQALTHCDKLNGITS